MTVELLDAKVNAKAAKAKPLPYLVVCAFTANAASFVLPISNPANLVLYGNHIPALWPWLKQFSLPSILSIAATYAVLRFLFHKDLRGEIETKVAVSDLSDGGRYAAYGIAATAAALLLASRRRACSARAAAGLARTPR